MVCVTPLQRATPVILDADSWDLMGRTHDACRYIRRPRYSRGERKDRAESCRTNERSNNSNSNSNSNNSSNDDDDGDDGDDDNNDNNDNDDNNHNPQPTTNNQQPPTTNPQPQPQQQQQQQEQGTNNHWDPVLAIYLFLFLPLRVQTNTGTPSLLFRPPPTTSLLLGPFLCRERAGSSKKGAAATSAQTFTFFQVLGLDPSKRSPAPHQLRPSPFSRCWTPFPAVSGRDPPKRGAAT